MRARAHFGSLFSRSKTEIENFSTNPVFEYIKIHNEFCHLNIENTSELWFLSSVSIRVRQMKWIFRGNVLTPLLPSIGKRA